MCTLWCALKGWAYSSSTFLRINPFPNTVEWIFVAARLFYWIHAQLSYDKVPQLQGAVEHSSVIPLNTHSVSAIQIGASEMVLQINIFPEENMALMWCFSDHCAIICTAILRCSLGRLNSWFTLCSVWLLCDSCPTGRRDHLGWLPWMLDKPARYEGKISPEGLLDRLHICALCEQSVETSQNWEKAFNPDRFTDRPVTEWRIQCAKDCSDMCWQYTINFGFVTCFTYFLLLSDLSP